MGVILYIRILSCLTFLVTAACSYPVTVAPAPALDVYASYTEKLPGKYALLVEATSLSRTIAATGQACSAHNYPANANEAFKVSAVKTIEGLVETIEVVSTPMSRETMGQKGYRGLIIVKADDYSARLMFVPDFWSATATASADVSGSIVIDGPNGRLFGTSSSSTRTVDQQTGSCGAGAQIIGQATSMAIKELFERLGERLANEPKLRTAPTQASNSPSS